MFGKLPTFWVLFATEYIILSGRKSKSGFRVLWPSGLVHWTQFLVLSECGFESRPGQLRCLCLWARHLYLLRPSDGTLSCRSRVLCNARKRTQDTYREREGACPGVSGFAPWAPSRVDTVVCALQIFCIIIIVIISLYLGSNFSSKPWGFYEEVVLQEITNIDFHMLI